MKKTKMSHVKWMEEAATDNIILSQLVEDWISADAFSFWRFFPTKKAFLEWCSFLKKVCDDQGASVLEMYKSDVAGMILVLDKCVVRTYRTARFLKIRPLYRLRSPVLERCILSKQLPNVGVFVCKKIRPLLTMDMELSMSFSKKQIVKLEKDVQKAVGKIHSVGYCHNDLSIDNTGYDEESGHFVVFDFDAASRHVSPQHKMDCLLRDEANWHRSMKTWSEKMNMKTKRQ